MRRLIYQVSVGKPSRLYAHCIESVKAYAEEVGADHIVQTQPKLWIKPDPFTSGRSAEASNRLGCLPIFEKENAFEYLSQYDQVAIIDADIWIRPGSPNVFETLEPEMDFGAVIEATMPITPAYRRKIINYSAMQYAELNKRGEVNMPVSEGSGWHFANMGMMVLNSKNFSERLGGKTAKQFIGRPDFKRFVDGVGTWKWSTDQTLLNYWVHKDNIKMQNLDWKFNGLFTANTRIEECHFVHFFLKDKLPNAGENIEELMKYV